MIHLLVSYAYAQGATQRAGLDALLSCPGVRVLVDSGAFTAWTSGKEVALPAYLEFCRWLGGREFAHVQLDVIGDAEQSRRNLLDSYAAGLSPVPVLIETQPAEQAAELAPMHPERRVCVPGSTRKYPGSVERMSRRFAAAWRACGGDVRLHALGYDRWPAVLAEPVSTCDSSRSSINGSKFPNLLLVDGEKDNRHGVHQLISRWWGRRSAAPPQAMAFVERCGVTPAQWGGDPRLESRRFTSICSHLQSFYRQRAAEASGRRVFSVSTPDGDGLYCAVAAARYGSLDGSRVDYQAALAAVDELRASSWPAKRDLLASLLSASPFAAAPPERLVVVGEAPPARGTGSAGALDGDSGRRLARLAGAELGDLLASCDRVNLLPTAEWSAPAAREAAERLAPRLHGRRALLLGARVAEAFGLAGAPQLEWLAHRGGLKAACPHPSGLNRAMNDPATRRAVGDLLAPHVAAAQLSLPGGA